MSASDATPLAPLAFDAGAAQRRPRPERPPLDPATAAQAEAAHPEASVWVSANAGSGKTRVLTNRVARLLLSGAAPSRILCLTYTKAAAAEMQNRLFSTLGAWSLMDDAALVAEIDRLLTDADDGVDFAEARRLFARALETPGGLKIQTIHAFCESLLRRFPLEAGVSPHFEVADEQTAQALRAEARDRAVLARAEDPALSAALTRLLAELDEDGLDSLLVQVAGKRAAYARAAPDAEAALAAALGLPAGARPQAIAADWAGRLDPDRLKNLAEAVEASKTKAGPVLGAAMKKAVGAPPASAFAALAGAFLTKDGKKPRESGLPADVRKAQPWADAAFTEMKEAFLAAWRDSAAAERLEASVALTAFGARVLAEYAAGKAARAALDYDDLIERAVALLTRADARDWVRYKLDGGVEHVLVDEAQDTSPMQWRAIEALAGEFFAGGGAHEALSETPRTLFAVGDEKQSIYSFQGADPKLLSHHGGRFAKQAKEAKRVFRRSALKTSFRSAPAILSFVDRVFAPEAARQGLVFEADRPVEHIAHKNKPGRVDVWPLLEPRPTPDAPGWDEPLDAPAADNPERRLAELVAETIHGWIGRERLPSQKRLIAAGDVLVLVRKRGALSTGIIKGLKKRGAAVSGEDRLMLTGEMAVKDMLALARFCLNPEDDLTLATLLRSPLCSVSEEALFELAHYRPRRRRLWYALRDAAGDGGPVAATPATPAYAQAYGFLSELVARADFLRPFELFAQALGPMGARARLVARLGPEAEDPLDELLTQTLAFERSGAPSLQNFVRWMAAREAEIKREHEQGRDEVRVMTAHGAKGLEAPVVVLPDTTSTPGGGRASSLYPFPEASSEVAALTAAEGAEGVCGAPPPPLWAPRSNDADPQALLDLRTERAEREAEEHRRLLYVALTRAEERLLICGARGRSGKGAAKLDESAWHALCAAAIEAMAADAPKERTVDGSTHGDDGAPDDAEAQVQTVATPLFGPDGDPLPGYRLESGRAELQEVAPAPRVDAAPVASEPWLNAPAIRETAPADIAPSHLGGADPEQALDQAEAVGERRGAGRGFGPGLPPHLAKRRGVLIHLLLQVLGEPGAFASPRARRLSAERLIAREGDGFDAAACEAMILEALGVIEEPAFAWAFAAGSRAEVPVGAVLPALGPGEIRGVIDRLVVADDAVTLIDFKTGAAPDQPPEGYVRQLSVYRAALERIFPQPIEAALLWTGLPRLDPIARSALDHGFAAAKAEVARRVRTP